jgi:hypothetical protein
LVLEHPTGAVVPDAFALVWLLCLFKHNREVISIVGVWRFPVSDDFPSGLADEFAVAHIERELTKGFAAVVRREL